MPMHPQPPLLFSLFALRCPRNPFQEHIIRFRESAIPRADVDAHAEELVAAIILRRGVFEWEGGCRECDAVVVGFGVGGGGLEEGGCFFDYLRLRLCW